MSIFSGIVGKVLIGVASTAASSFLSGGSRGSGAGSYSRAARELSFAQKRRDALSTAKELTRLGGGYDPIKKVQRPEYRRSRALDPYYAAYKGLVNNNPYYRDYVNYSRGQAPSQPTKVSDTLTGTEASMFSEASPRKQVSKSFSTI